MNLRFLDLSRRRDVLEPKTADKIDENLEKRNQKIECKTQRAFSPVILFKSPARMNNLLTLNQKDQFRSSQYLRTQSNASKVNYQKVIVQKLEKQEALIIAQKQK